MILKDVTGDDSPKPLTTQLLKKIFLFYGENDVADDDGLLEEMITVASRTDVSDEERAHSILDKFTFAHCLTDDVRKYQIENENKLTTNYVDVFHTHRSTKKSSGFFNRTVSCAEVVLDGGDNDFEESVRPVELRHTMSSIGEFLHC